MLGLVSTSQFSRYALCLIYLNQHHYLHRIYYSVLENLYVHVAIFLVHTLIHFVQIVIRFIQYILCLIRIREPNFILNSFISILDIQIVFLFSLFYCDSRGIVFNDFENIWIEDHFNITTFRKHFFLSKKKTPAGKCTHGKDVCSDFHDLKGRMINP